LDRFFYAYRFPFRCSSIQEDSSSFIVNYLILVSLFWAFSFGLISTQFSGLSPALLASIRLSLATLVFLPFLRIKPLTKKDILSYFFIGLIQYGVMYLLFFAAFPYIKGQSYLIALFTITTPIYVVLWSQSRFSLLPWIGAFFAVAGAGVINWQTSWNGDAWIAFGLLQGSNLAFAFGQIAYRKIKTQHETIEDHSVYALLFAGATFLTFIVTLFDQSFSQVLDLNQQQWLTLLYLGIVASGLCFFWWNKGATQTPPPVLAVMNNLKVPLAISVSLIVFQEWKGVSWAQFTFGIILIALGLIIAQRTKRPPSKP